MRIKSSYIIVFIIIIAIVGISIVLPEVFFSDPSSEVIVEDDWTPAVSETPTRTLTPSITLTPLKSPTLTITSSPTPSTDCVYPSLYWEVHPELWLEIRVGNTLYTQTDIGLIFNDSSQEIHYMILKQFYLANLNIYSGADPTLIENVLGQTNTWLQEYFPDKQPPEGDRQLGVQLVQTLFEYNSGLIGPGFCSPFETLAVTPLVIADPIVTPSPSPTATSTATRVFVTLRPTATATRTQKPDKPEPTDPPRPTDPPIPEPTSTDPPPPPTVAPTSAPPEDTPIPTDPPQPTDPGDKPTPTPAS